MDDCSADPIVVPRLSHETFRPWSEDSSFPEAAAHGFEDGDVGVCQTQNLSRFSCDLGSRLGSGELPGSTGKHAGLFLNVPVSRNSSFSCVKLISYIDWSFRRGSVPTTCSRIPVLLNVRLFIFLITEKE